MPCLDSAVIRWANTATGLSLKPWKCMPCCPSAQEVDKQVLAHGEQIDWYYNQHARTLPEIHIGSSVAIQDSTTKRWDIPGVVTHRRYYIKTASGRVLVRNRRFLRRRVPTVPPRPIQDTSSPVNSLRTPTPTWSAT